MSYTLEDYNRAVRIQQEEGGLVSHILRERFKKLTQPQSKEVYSDCKNPGGCVYCGGNCPYVPAKSSDVPESANDFKYRWSITNPQG